MQDGISQHLARELQCPDGGDDPLLVLRRLRDDRHRPQAGSLRAAARTTQPLLQIGRGVLLSLEICVMVLAFVHSRPRREPRRLRLLPPDHRRPVGPDPRRDGRLAPLGRHRRGLSRNRGDPRARLEAFFDPIARIPFASACPVRALRACSPATPRDATPRHVLLLHRLSPAGVLMTFVQASGVLGTDDPGDWGGWAFSDITGAGGLSAHPDLRGWPRSARSRPFALFPARLRRVPRESLVFGETLKTNVAIGVDHRDLPRTLHLLARIPAPAAAARPGDPSSPAAPSPPKHRRPSFFWPEISRRGCGEAEPTHPDRRTQCADPVGPS